MSVWIRRTLIGVGAALLVGGWGITGWVREGLLLAHENSTMAQFMNAYIAGVVSMALGAGLIGFGAIRTNKEAG